MGRPPRRAARLGALVAVVALAALTAGCGTSGRAMRQPAPGATAPPRHGDATTTTGAGFNTLVASGLFALTSTAFPPAGTVPVEYTCDGAGTSPPLTWANLPAGTAELALVVTDADTPGYVHWVVTGIDPATNGLPAGTVPAGATQLTNSAGKVGWAPLCPPAGGTAPGAAHTYDFTLYALSAPSGVTARTPTSEAIATLASDADGTTVLTGTYARTSAN